MTAVLAVGPVHGSAVAIAGKGALFIGPSGSGKSAHCLAMLSLGAALIADDLLMIGKQDADLFISAPQEAEDCIEVRNVGIVRCDAVASAALTVVIDLAQSEDDRLPPHRTVNIEGNSVDLIHGGDVPNLAPAVYLWLKHGRKY